MDENNVSMNDANASETVAPITELGGNIAVVDDKTGLLVPRHRRRRKVSLASKKARAGYIFTLPFLLGVILIYFPILIDSIWVSFGKWDYSGKVDRLEMVGFDNYTSILTGSSAFYEVLLEGLQQLIFQVPAIIVFSLFIAVVLNQKMLGRAAFRAIFFIPVIISTGIMEAVNVADKMTAASQAGPNDGSGETSSSGIVSTMDIERIFSSMQIPGGGAIIEFVVKLVNDVYNIINFSGVQMLIFLAGLQSISPAIYEACQIEGATGWETFWKITFPMISPMILVNAVYTVIDSFTRADNPTMAFIDAEKKIEPNAAMSWTYFIVVVLIIAAVAGIVSTFIFYQRKD